MKKMNKESLERMAKAMKEVKGIVNLAKKKKDGNVDPLTAEKVTEIVASEFAKHSKAPERKGEFEDVDNLAGLDSYKFAILQKSSDATVLELQAMNDDLIIMGSVLAKSRGCSQSEAITSTKLYQKFVNHKGVSELRKAIDGTTGKGLEWIPTLFSADLIDKVRLQLKVAALFNRVEMPSSPYTLPVEGADAIGYLVTNTSSDDVRDANAMPIASTPGTTNMTFTAKKLGARTVFNEETSEDSIIGIMDYVKRQVIQALANAIENATLNGSTAATHPDYDIQTDPNSAKLNDRAWDGFRQMIQDATNWSSGATFNQAAIVAARKSMGKYGTMATDLAIVVSTSVSYQFLNNTNFPDVQTLEKYGPNAVILVGELGKIYGVPIIVSEFQRDNVAAAGFNTVGGPNTKSTMAMVNRNAMLYGDRRQVTSDSQKNIETDKVVVVSKTRMDYQRKFATTEKAIAGLNNITP
jgi:HK97 family phage major capsid protein